MSLPTSDAKPNEYLGYVAVPRSVIKDASLTAKAKIVYVYCLEGCTEEQIVTATRWSAGRVSRSLGELRRHGLIPA